MADIITDKDALEYAERHDWSPTLFGMTKWYILEQLLAHEMNHGDKPPFTWSQIQTKAPKEVYENLKKQYDNMFKDNYNCGDCNDYQGFLCPTCDYAIGDGSATAVMHKIYHNNYPKTNPMHPEYKSNNNNNNNNSTKTLTMSDQLDAECEVKQQPNKKQKTIQEDINNNNNENPEYEQYIPSLYSLTRDCVLKVMKSWKTPSDKPYPFTFETMQNTLEEPEIMSLLEEKESRELSEYTDCRDCGRPGTSLCSECRYRNGYADAIRSYH